jgi:hypothetical protein
VKSAAGGAAAGDCSSCSSSVAAPIRAARLSVGFSAGRGLSGA